MTHAVSRSVLRGRDFAELVLAKAILLASSEPDRQPHCSRCKASQQECYSGYLQWLLRQALLQRADLAVNRVNILQLRVHVRTLQIACVD